RGRESDFRPVAAVVRAHIYQPNGQPIIGVGNFDNPSEFPDHSRYGNESGAYNFAAQAVEVEVDRDTGVVRIDRFTAVDDFGKIINPMIVEGQVHGGLTQGIGQALTEGCRYDATSGQLVTGSFMDYCMPRAGDVPYFKIDTRETPCTHNPLGVKGCGEAGAIGAPAAVMNAVTDALGIRDVAMPATAQTVWKHLQEKSHARV
ncbi:MAG: aerobic carbon-monoxide dehydrogenase large subunit, partial [Betaproteobacteria bacterium]|nr:aerobic carbon-monoxide dehydrogenase large subunit [Betaproteobacteria bacterium]